MSCANIKCMKAIKTNAYKIQCTKCNSWYHRDCANLTIEKIQEYSKEKNSPNGKRWLYTTCNGSSDDVGQRDPSNVSEDVSNSTHLSLKEENNYLKQLISELRESNILLKQNKQLLEEKVLDLQKQLTHKKPKTNNSKDISSSNKKGSVSIHVPNVSTPNELNPQSAPLPTESNRRGFVFPEQGTSKSLNTRSNIVGNESPSAWAHVVSSQPNPERRIHSNKSYTTSKRPIFIGTGELDVNENFVGRDDKNKKVWLFLSKVPDKINEVIIKNYIQKKTNLTEEEVFVKHLQTKIEQKYPNNKCFQVGIRFDLKEDVYLPTFWPKNVAFQRFKFKKQYDNEGNENKTSQNGDAFL